MFKVAVFRFDTFSEDEFGTAWLPCKSLAGQVHPMQTQCAHATRQRLWFDVARPLLGSLTRLCSPLDSSPDCSVATVWAEWSLVSRLSVTRLSHEPDAPAHCLAEKWRSYKVKVVQWKSILSKLCMVLSERQTVIFFSTEITFISRAIPILSKGSPNYE